MNTWFSLLPLEMKEQQAAQLQPTEEMKEGESVLGEITSEDQRNLWSLSTAMKKDAELKDVELKFSKYNSSDKAKILELQAKARAIDMIFWIGVIDDLGLWGFPDHVSVRSGWQVISYKPPECPITFPFFPGNK